MGSLANCKLHFIIVYIIFCSLHICDNCIIKYININNLYLSISNIFNVAFLRPFGIYGCIKEKDVCVSERISFYSIPL